MNTTDKIMTIIGEAFREGFYSVRTYNDTVLNNADEEFQSAATSLAKKVIAEIEALVRDADRYRWLTDDHPKFETRAKVYEVAMYVNTRSKSHIDATIDTAMQEKQS